MPGRMNWQEYRAAKIEQLLEEAQRAFRQAEAARLGPAWCSYGEHIAAVAEGDAYTHRAARFASEEPPGWWQ